MKWFRHLSIYYKFNAIIIGMLVLNLIMGAVMIQTASNLIEDQMEKRGAELASYLGVLSSNDILLDDRYALSDRINKTKQNSDDVRYIIVADSAGRILAHTFDDQFPQGLPAMLMKTANSASIGAAKYHVAKYDSNEGLIREVIHPVENGDIGYIRVGLSERQTEQVLDRRVNDFMVAILLLSVLSAVGATYMAFVIVRPLRGLTQAAEQIGHGNFAVQTVSVSQDEVGKLSVVFNDMAKKLQEKQIENDRLLEELKIKEAMRAELIRKLFVIQEDERKHLSRELHDETGQLLASLLAYMKLLFSKLADEGQKELLQKARDVAIHALGSLRKIAVDLRPPVLDDLGLAAAMSKYSKTFSEQQGINVHITLPEDKAELGSEISLALYRILQESLTNIAKHAAAENVYISLFDSSKHISLIIRDDGVGIDNMDEREAKRQKNNLGIYGMSERAELLGGTMKLESLYGVGTTVYVTLPKKLG
jgi:signal transduction histidine kinase